VLSHVQSYGYTPLYAAVQHDHVECAKLLLEFGAEKDGICNVRAPHASPHPPPKR
jgi:ankyrin repeat protein